MARGVSCRRHSVPANSCVSQASCTLSSDSLLSEIVDHLLYKLEAVLHVLGLSIAISAVLLPESDADTGLGLSNNSTASSSGQLSDGLVGVLVGHHELSLAHANASLTWVPVAISSTTSAGDFADVDLLDRAIHALKRMLVIREISTFSALSSPEGTILTVDCSTVGNILDSPIIGVVIELMHELLSVGLPVSHFSNL